MRRATWALALASAFVMLVLAPGASAGPTGDLNVQDGHVLVGEVGAGTDAVAASELLNGTWSWFFSIDDNDVSVTNPTITVDSGFPVSAFPGGLGASSFPVTVSQSSLEPGNSFFSNPLAQFGVTTIPATMSPGFDSTRSVTPPTIPIGGGQQVLNVTITPRTTGPGYKVGIGDDIAGTTVTQVSGPSTPMNLQADTTYTLVYDLNVPNPFGVPFAFKPQVDVNGGLSATISGGCCTGPTNSVSFADPSLDGGTPGRGHVTYSVDQTVNSWSIINGDARQISYDELLLLAPTSTDQCTNGNWRQFSMFKNQGDCVSYVASSGKNPPTG